MGVQIILSRTSGVPIYEQIKSQIKTAILRGDVADGEALPSIRGLARDLQVSVITTTRAFSDLANEGFVAHVPGKGSYALSPDSTRVKEQVLDDLRSTLREAVRIGHVASLSSVELHQALDDVLKEES